MENQYSKDNLYTRLIQDFEKYSTPRIKSAFEWAYDLHDGQIRKSGQPYIIHPIEVARQLMALGLDEETMMSALLHDAIEDCGVTYDDINKKFGKTVAELVLAETKIDDLTSHSHAKFEDYGNLKRMLISMTDDIRVLLIRLSDRLHNMKTIEYLKPERKITYSQETLNVYVPLAEYINIGMWKRELEDIAFRNVNTELYEQVTSLIQNDTRSNPQHIHNIKVQLEDLMRKHKIPCKVSGRIKSASSLHHKIRSQINKGKITGYNADKVLDLLAFRIITDNSNIIDCYKALGAIHAEYHHIPSEFDDYIAKPKDNGYQSLQTDIYVDPDNKTNQDPDTQNKLVLEVQIRTKKMHEYNEFGAASHIAYKLQGSKANNTASAFGWVKNLMKWQEKSATDFSIKNVLSDKVFVFTPKGKVIEMEKGATVIDFAYRIHTAVGNACTGAKIDDKIVPLSTKIKTGEVIEILTAKNKIHPSKEWATWCLPKTASVIRREIQNLDREKQIELGEDMFKTKMRESELDFTNKEIELIANEYTGGNVEELFRRVYLKMLNINHIFTQYKRAHGLLKNIKEEKSSKEHETKFTNNSDSSPVVLPQKSIVQNTIPGNQGTTILIDGHTGMQYYIAKCCSPTPSHSILGFVSLEHGVTVHKNDCATLTYLDPTRFVPVTWSQP